MLPRDNDHVFFGNSGSEAVDTALKIALAYWQAKGEPGRVRFISRQRGYHGVGFGGTAVGGIEANRKQFAANLLPLVDHIPHTHDLSRNAFSRVSSVKIAALFSPSSIFRRLIASVFLPSSACWLVVLALSCSTFISSLRADIANSARN